MNINEVHWNFSDNGTKEPAKSRFWNFYNFWTAWNFLMRFLLLCSGEWALSFYMCGSIYIGVSLRMVFLQVIIPKSISKCVIQQVAHLRTLFIWLDVNVVTCNTLVKQINKFPNVWIVIDLISIITMIKAMLLMLLCI